MASTVNRVIKNTGWLYGKMGITMLLSLYTTRLVLAALGTTDYGIYNVVGGAIVMMGFLSSAMAITTQRFMSYAEGENNQDSKITVFNISVVIHFVIAIISALILIIAGYFLINYILNYPSERYNAVCVVYACLICSTFFTITAVPYEAVLNAHENMKYYSIVSVFDAILKLLIAIYCTRAKGDVLIIYGILMAIVPFITRTIMRIYCKQKYEECHRDIKKYYDKGKAKQIIKFASWNLLGSVGGLVGNNGQGIISNMFFGVAINAAEGVCGQIHSILLVFSNNMLKALNPVIVKSEGEGNRAKMISWSLKGCKYSFILFAWLTIPVFFEIDYILNLWLTEVPDWTVFFIRMVFVRTQIELLFGALVTSLGAVGDIKSYYKMYSSLLLGALVIVYFAYRMGAGPDFRYWLLLFFVIIQGNCTIYLCKRLFGLDLGIYAKKVLFPVTILAFLMVGTSAIVTIIMPTSMIRLAINCLVTWSVAIVSVFTFFCEKAEKDFLLSLLKSATSKIIKLLYVKISNSTTL